MSLRSFVAIKIKYVVRTFKSEKESIVLIMIHKIFMIINIEFIAEKLWTKSLILSDFIWDFIKKHFSVFMQTWGFFRSLNKNLQFFKF